MGQAIRICILPLQDWLSMDGNLRRENPADEVINVPANPQHYWRYRMHVKIEDLINNIDFKENITELINQSGRK